MRRRLRAGTLAVAIVASSSLLAAQEWPRFRGNEAGVAADDPALPDTWSPTENVAWTRPIPGIGWSSPVVWGDHVFVTSVVNTAQQEPPKPGFYLGDWPASPAPHRWMVYDIDFRTGAVRWEREVSSAPPGKAKHLKNSYASETAVTDGERVYFYFANAGLFAFDFSGKQVWSKPIGPFKTRNNWGSGGSPVLHRDRVYIVNDNDEQSFLAAYDTRTGAEIWKVDRKEGTNWSTPFVWENDQRTEIVTSGSDRVRSYDLSGTLLWEFSGMSSISIPTPFSRFGMLYISSGYIADPKRPAYAIKPGASGDISLQAGETSNQFVVWSLPTGAPYNPSPIIYGETYYTLFDRGFFTSHDARTGKELYGRQRVTAEASGFTSSPWAYNGKIFAMSEEGDTYVIQAGPEFKVLGKNSLGEMTLATPAISRGSLIVRTASKLYRLSNRPATAPARQATSLFDGTLTQWNLEGTTATADGDVLAVGDGNGWVRRNGVRGDFTLSMDMRLIGSGAKAGIYVRAWPTLDPKSGVPTNGYRVNLANNATSPDGISQWQRVEIVCSGRTATVTVNGREVLTRDDVPNPQGFVALSVQGGRAEFRRIELSTPPRQLSSRQPAEGAARPGGRVVLPRPLKEVKPQYTADAMRARISGGVMLEAVVREDGTVGTVEVVQSLDPHNGLDDAAVFAAKQWRFEPGTREGKPVAVLVTIELSFLLR